MDDELLSLPEEEKGTDILNGDSVIDSLADINTDDIKNAFSIGNNVKIEKKKEERKLPKTDTNAGLW